LLLNTKSSRTFEDPESVCSYASIERTPLNCHCHPIPSRLAALIQLNTGMRISEPVLTRLDDLVLDHDIPHLWVRKNCLTDRKTQIWPRTWRWNAVCHQRGMEVGE
jgi:integrase